MQELKTLFKPHVAKSHPLTTYSAGEVPLISNGLESNGFVKYVTPQPKDAVYNFTGICVSAFGEATVQKPPFISRGCAGSGLIVLEPLVEMNESILLSYAAYFNRAISWRFSYGRMASSKRLEKIMLPLPGELPIISIKSKTPVTNSISYKTTKIKLESYPLANLFAPVSGDYHKAEELPDGDIPLVSCGTDKNGIVRYCDIPKKYIYHNALTVAYNGQPLTTKYHPYQFGAKDDIAVLIPKKSLKGTTLLFIQMMLNKEQWRYSYGRKCFKAKLSKMQILLPLKNNQVDEQLIENIMTNTSYWGFISTLIHNTDVGTQIPLQLSI
jgi:Type I restriction modification DNA specificity domain